MRSNAGSLGGTRHRARSTCFSLFALILILASCRPDRTAAPFQSKEDSSLPASLRVIDLGGRQFQVTFLYRPIAPVQSVHLAGTFNGWNPTAQRMDGPAVDSTFRTTVVLPAGRHEYKFVIDGHDWQTDPANPWRTAGYANAILLLGTPSDAHEGAVHPADRPVKMIRAVAHPAALDELKRALADADAGAAGGIAALWFETHPMPLFSAEAVTWVFCDPAATAVALSLAEAGRRTGYPMQRLVAGRPVWVVSLKRSGLGDRLAYTYEVTGQRFASVLDPHAWSCTSRAGRPAGRVVEATAERGRIALLPELAAGASGLRPRDIYVYLPPGYDEHTDERYPVLYLHDGQNCWDDPVEPFGHGGWALNLKADELIRSGAVAPFVAVGVGNTADRMEEYGPGPDIRSADSHPYLKFLIETLKPLIDKRYRTRPEAANTAIMGASMGGLVSFQAALLQPDVFGQAGCLSPSFVVFGTENNPYVTLLEQTEKVPVRFYFYNGTGGRGADGAPGTRRVVQMLRRRGWCDDRDLVHHEADGAEHNERAWREELDAVLRYFFGV